MKCGYGSLIAGVVGALFASAATSAFAQDAAVKARPKAPAVRAATFCQVWPTAGTPDLKIAVASNFFDPAKDLVTAFTATGQPGAGKRVNICHNATGDLLGEITAGSSGYGLFLAANAAAPDSLVGSTWVPTGATSDLYATGIPVMFARYQTVTNVQTLIPTAPSGVKHTFPNQMTTSDPISITNAQTIAVADTGDAPYGMAAYQVMHDMGQWPTLGTIPTGVSNPLYDNIALTFESVATSPYPSKSGFVSKAQICSGIKPVPPNPPTFIYIEFKYSTYLRQQKGILVKSGIPSQDLLAASLRNYMLNNTADPDFWPDFLDDHCYGPI